MKEFVYRPEIDGLRAIAVVAVILFHAGFSLFEGGYVGVDIFFVLSGYLISTLILKERDAGTFSLRGFYERRARRILPALALVTILSIPFAWMWMTPDQLLDFSRSMVGVFTFTANFVFIRDINYFNGRTDLVPLLHTWSIAVEEQFYIFFPVFTLVVLRFWKKMWVPIVGVVLILSLGFHHVQ